MPRGRVFAAPVAAREQGAPALSLVPLKDEAAGRRSAAPSARTRVLLFLGLLGIYAANGREIGAPDTSPNILLPIAILRGDGPVLNRFEATLRGDGGEPPYFVEAHGDLLLSRYPILPALLAVPVTWPQLMLLDRTHPDWMQNPAVASPSMRVMAKSAAALVAALVGMLLYGLLLELGLGEVAVTATLATALGSELWMVASQSPWQHGSAALFLVLSLLLVVPARGSRTRLVGAGLAAAAAVCARSTNAAFAVPLAIWALFALGRRALWLLVPAAAVGALLLTSNVLLFGNVLGGLGAIESLGHAHHGLHGSLTDEPLTSLAGTLFSPNRGLFVFSPWALLALAALPATAPRLAGFAPLRAMLLGLLPFTLVISGYGVWWAGESFGPRYGTEAMPLFGVLLAFALVWARTRSPATRAVFHVAIAFSIALQAIGALCYPSDWNKVPGSVDLHHDRLWDWRDTEIRRCLEEGPWVPASYLAVWRRLTR